MPDLTDFLNIVASAEDWTGFGAALHRRVRAACARRGLRPSSVLRDLLEREFPDTSGQFRLPL